MKKFSKIIELFKEKQQFKRANEEWEYLGMSRGGYYDMKTGRGGLKDTTVEKLMIGTNLEAVEIEAAWKSEFSRSEIVRKSWAKMANVATLFSVSIFLLTSPIVLTAKGISHFDIQNNVYYVK